MTAGAGIPYYTVNKSEGQNKGTGFGFGKKIGELRKSESPGPGKYENNNSSYRSFSQNQKTNKQGKFGIGYDKFYLVSSQALNNFRHEIFQNQ